VLINRLLRVYVRRHFDARQEATECWRHFSVSGWCEFCRALTKTCEPVWANNYSRTKRHYLVKITSWTTNNHMSLSQKEPDKRLRRNYNPHQSRERQCDVRAFQFLLPAFESGFRCSRNGGPWIISLYLWYQVYFKIIIVKFVVTVLSITYF